MTILPMTPNALSNPIVVNTAIAASAVPIHQRRPGDMKMPFWSFRSRESGSKARRRSPSGGSIPPIPTRCAIASDGSPARVGLAVVEVSVSYDGTSWMQGVQLLESRGNKVARERIYVMAAWEAPEVAGALARGHSRRPREEISPIVARS